MTSPGRARKPAANGRRPATGRTGRGARRRRGGVAGAGRGTAGSRSSGKHDFSGIGHGGRRERADIRADPYFLYRESGTRSAIPAARAERAAPGDFPVERGERRDRSGRARRRSRASVGPPRLGPAPPPRGLRPVPRLAGGGRAGAARGEGARSATVIGNGGAEPAPGGRRSQPLRNRHELVSSASGGRLLRPRVRGVPGGNGGAGRGHRATLPMRGGDGRRAGTGDGRTERNGARGAWPSPVEHGRRRTERAERAGSVGEPQGPPAAEPPGNGCFRLPRDDFSEIGA